MMACLNKGDYNYVDSKGNWKYDTKPTEIVGTGTEFPLDRDHTSWEHQPQGWRKGLDRGHLLAAQLGGSGEDLRNLVPLYPNANRNVMKPYEDDLAKRIQGGQTIFYMVTADYSGKNPIPTQLQLSWVSSTGERSDMVTIPNTP
jgi:hypothetical protein